MNPRQPRLTGTGLGRSLGGSVPAVDDVPHRLIEVSAETADFVGRDAERVRILLADFGERQQRVAGAEPLHDLVVGERRHGRGEGFAELAQRDVGIETERGELVRGSSAETLHLSRQQFALREEPVEEPVPQTRGFVDAASRVGDVGSELDELLAVEVHRHTEQAGGVLQQPRRSHETRVRIHQRLAGARHVFHEIHDLRER